jgi:hypothetical protein
MAHRSGLRFRNRRRDLRIGCFDAARAVRPCGLALQSDVALLPTDVPLLPTDVPLLPIDATLLNVTLRDAASFTAIAAAGFALAGLQQRHQPPG